MLEQALLENSLTDTAEHINRKTTYNLPPNHKCHIKKVNTFRFVYAFGPLGVDIFPQAVIMSLSWVSKWEFGEGDMLCNP